MTSAPPTPPAVMLPQAPNPPPLFGGGTAQQKPKAKPSQPTFLGAGLTAQPQNQGFRTLLGGGLAA